MAKKRERKQKPKVRWFEKIIYTNPKKQTKFIFGKPLYPKSEVVKMKEAFRKSKNKR